MTNTLNSSGIVTESSAVENEDGSYTYTATLKGLTANWHSTTDWACTADVQITFRTPVGMPIPGSGSVFRFAENGGYNVYLSGTDFS